MPPLRLGVILASVREGRRGEAFARWILDVAGQRAELQPELLDLRAWPLQAYARKETPNAAKKGYAAGSLEARWRDTVAALDAFLVVTPEYNHSFPGQLKNALDAVYAPWGYKPVAFLSYGGFASGARAAEQLRLVAVELRMVPVREEVNVRLVGFAADERSLVSTLVHGSAPGSPCQYSRVALRSKSCPRRRTSTLFESV